MIKPRCGLHGERGWQGQCSGDLEYHPRVNCERNKRKDIHLRDHEVDHSDQAVTYSYEGRRQETC